jgi:hypothetical protein
VSVRRRRRVDSRSMVPTVAEPWTTCDCKNASHGTRPPVQFVSELHGAWQ